MMVWPQPVHACTTEGECNGTASHSKCDGDGEVTKFCTYKDHRSGHADWFLIVGPSIKRLSANKGEGKKGEAERERERREKEKEKGRDKGTKEALRVGEREGQREC